MSFTDHLSYVYDGRSSVGRPYVAVLVTLSVTWSMARIGYPSPALCKRFPSLCGSALRREGRCSRHSHATDPSVRPNTRTSTIFFRCSLGSCVTFLGEFARMRYVTSERRATLRVDPDKALIWNRQQVPYRTAMSALEPAILASSPTVAPPSAKERCRRLPQCVCNLATDHPAAPLGRLPEGFENRRRRRLRRRYHRQLEDPTRIDPLRVATLANSTCR
jgi:hypothetical protein